MSILYTFKDVYVKHKYKKLKKFTRSSQNSDKVGKGDTASLANIELSDGTPFIDFHFDNSQSDFTSRIIEESAGVLRVQANLLNPHSRSYFASDNTMDNGQGGRLGGIGYDGTDAYFIIDGSKHYVQLKN